MNKNPVFLTEIFIFWAVTCTAWKVSIFGVFLVCIFPHSDWIRWDTSYLYVFSPNAGKYRPEKTPNTNNFHAATWTADIRGVRSVFRTQSNIYNGAICEKAVYNFREKAPSLMLDWVLKTLLGVFNTLLSICDELWDRNFAWKYENTIRAKWGMSDTFW